MKHRLMRSQIGFFFLLSSSRTTLPKCRRKLLSAVVLIHFIAYERKKTTETATAGRDNKKTALSIRSQAREDLMKPHKNCSSFHHENCSAKEISFPDEKRQRKSIFMSSYIFYETAVLLLFVVDVKGESV
jgi:hypothetical protein